MTSLNLQELQHLEKLSCIKIDENKQSIFLDKLDNVINKLNELNKIDTN
jgi:Asp-tRNA(Asn)/Glu-tRNA(Gln) amidotransferase C subunit